MTKNDVKRLRGLLTVAAGSIAAVKGDFKTPDRMNISRMRSLINHWLDAGREMLDILDIVKPLQPDMFEETRPIIMDGDELVAGRVIISTNGAEHLVQEEADSDS
jgi:hypothetical protein